VEHARVELALVEAVVLDGKGRHVRDLPRSAFRLTAGGVEVPIVSFDEIDLTEAGARLAPETGSEPAAVEAETAAPPEEPVAPDPISLERREELRRSIEARMQGDRWFVMLFDGYNNPSPRRMAQVRTAAKKWLDKNLRERDMVAVFEINPFLSSITGFTNDIGMLKDAIDDARIFPGSSMGHEMIDQTLEQARVYERSYLEEKLRNVSRFSTDLLRAEQDQFYANLTNLSEVMVALEGTKAVMLFSGGFPLTMARSSVASGGFTARFRRMLAVLESQDIRVFSYDAGEEGGFTDAEEATNYRLALDELGFGTEWADEMQIGAQIDSLNAHHEILSVLGGETGGRFWRGRDYAAGLQAADDDLSHYYLIGFSPSAGTPQRKGRFDIKLKVSGEKKMRVISRRGTFSRDEQAVLATVAPVQQAAGAAGEPEPAALPLDLSCRPLFYPLDGMRTLAVLPILVDGPLSAVEIGPDQWVLDLDLTVTATMSGEVVDTNKRSIRLKFPERAALQITRGVQIREAIALPPSVLDLSVELRINGQNRSGEWRSAITVPVRGDESFGLTDLGLLNPASAAPLVYDVFVKGDTIAGTQPPSTLPDPLGSETAGRPPLYIDGGFSRSVPLLAQVNVTAPPAATEELPSPLSMDWELIPAGGGDAFAPPVQYRRLRMLGNGALLDVMVDLNLKEVPPGDYTLRLTARNLVSQAGDERARHVTIVP
jgi:VWFA-related protein